MHGSQHTRHSSSRRLHTRHLQISSLPRRGPQQRGLLRKAQGQDSTVLKKIPELMAYVDAGAYSKGRTPCTDSAMLRLAFTVRIILNVALAMHDCMPMRMRVLTVTVAHLPGSQADSAVVAADLAMGSSATGFGQGVRLSIVARWSNSIARVLHAQSHSGYDCNLIS